MQQAWDTALVRHVYDTHCIYEADRGCINVAKQHFNALVTEDVEQFGRQYPDFASNPWAVLRQSLADAESDTKLVTEYRQFLLPLIFGQVRPSYQDAFAIFKLCANELLTQSE